MNKRIIKNIIESKIESWLKSVTDEDLRNEMERNVIVTGGCIASLLLGEEVNDYDVYFRTKGTAKRVAEHYCKMFNERNTNHKNKLGGAAQAFVLDGLDVEEWKKGGKSLEAIAPGFSNQGGEKWKENGTWSRMIAGCTIDRIKVIVRSDGVAAEDGKEQILERPFENVTDLLAEAEHITTDQVDKEVNGEPQKGAFRPIFLSTNAITLSDKIQVVIRFHGEPEEIHANYDFAHCTNYWTMKDGLVLQQKALEALLAKELVYCGSKYPLCSMIRTRKFIKRGFNINAGQYLKMGFQLSKLDLTDIDVLEDQLVGVDSAYFMVLIDALRKQAAENPNFEVEESYVATIIDKIF